MISAINQSDVDMLLAVHFSTFLLYVISFRLFLTVLICSHCLNSLQFLQLFHQLGFLVRSHACKYCGSHQNLKWQHKRKGNLMLLFELKHHLIKSLSLSLCPIIIVCICNWCISMANCQIFLLLGLNNLHYLWQMFREVITEGSKGLAINSQVIAKTTLIQALRGEGKISITTTKTSANKEN